MVIGSQIKLNLVPSGVMPVVYINQGDAGYDKEFLIYNGDTPYNVPSGVSATIRGTKADGYGVTEVATVTTGSNLVTVTITEQMVAAAGENIYELVFVDTDGLRIATINMVWAIKADALGDAVISESDLDYASQVLDQLQSVSAFKAQLDANTNGISAETSARISADSALSNQISNEATIRAAADNTLQNNINAEAATRSSQDGNLQAQINQLVAPTGAAPSAAEIENARIGADGVTYSTLGSAIRTQIVDIKDILSSFIGVNSTNLVKATTWSDGYYVNINNGGLGSNSTWSATDYIQLSPNTEYTIVRTGGVAVLGALFTQKSTNGYTRGINQNPTAEAFTITTSSTETYIRLSLATSDKANLGIYTEYYGEVALKDDVIVPTLLDKLEINSTAVNPTNYSTLLPDVNTVLSNTAYKMYFSMRSSAIPANLPFDTWITQSPATLVTFGVNIGNNAGIQQVLIGNNFVFVRTYASAWTDWIALKLEINVGSGYGVEQHFTSLTKAILLATKYKNAVVNVYNGTFDLYQEFIEQYGSDFFTNYTANTRPKGLHLTNNVYVKCSSNSKIVFHYTGNNVNVLEQFSPIDYLSDCVDGFTLENATVECSRCRYAVHDDPSDTSRAYHNRYINCKFSIDNSNNASWPQESVLGGGLGRAGAVTIDGCIFDSVEFMTGTDVAVHRLLSYHNDVSTDQAINSVEIRNCYLSGNGKIVVYYGGTNPADSSKVIIAGNSMGAGIVEAPSRTSDTIHNMKIYEWNNVIRN